VNAWARTPRRRKRWVAGALLLLLLGTFSVVVPPVVDFVLFAPWAYDYFGRSTLTGNWIGHVTTPRGARYVVYLELHRYTTSRGNPSRVRHGRAAIDGAAWWCAHHIPSTTAPLYGSADRSASDVRLGVDDPEPLRAGLGPSTFRGVWHGSTLVVQVGFRRLNAQGAAISSSTNPDDTQTVTMTLRKGQHNAYQSACARL
jgi:hypothetical protein